LTTNGETLVASAVTSCEKERAQKGNVFFNGKCNDKNKRDRKRVGWTTGHNDQIALIVVSVTRYGEQIEMSYNAYGKGNKVRVEFLHQF